MNMCASKANKTPLMTEELCHGHVIGRKTMERALDVLNMYFEEILWHIHLKLDEIYPDINTDVYVDGSHIERYGSKCGNTAVGEGGGTMQLQDQFMVAQLKESGIPIGIEMYPRNWNDPPQYADFIPQLMFMLKKGSTIIMDNGGSSGELPNDICDSGMEYISRVRMNQSDLDSIENDIGKMTYVGHGVGCINHEFERGRKTNYLFFSVDRYILGQSAAERKAARMAVALSKARDAFSDPDIRKLVTVQKNPFYDVRITKYELQMKLNPWTEDDIIAAADEISGDRCGWFKIQSSVNLPPDVVLDAYRHRTGIEHLIASLKGVVKIGPLRVWDAKHVRGELLLGLLAQLMLSMVRYDLEPDTVEKFEDRRRIVKKHKPSMKAILQNLGQWTVTVIPKDEWNKKVV